MRVINLKAKHFKDAHFGLICECALARAVKEACKVSEVSVGLWLLDVPGLLDREYGKLRVSYNPEHFYEDLSIAQHLWKSDPEKIIRSLEADGLDDIIKEEIQLSETTIDNLLKEEKHDTKIKSETYQEA